MSLSVPALLVHAPHGNGSICSVVWLYPGDSVGEEDVQGASSDGYRTPTFMSTSAISPTPFTGKTRKRRKTREPFYKGYWWSSVPSRRYKEAHRLLAEFIAGNTTVRDEMVYVLGALLRLKQLTRREYTDINNRLAST